MDWKDLFVTVATNISTGGQETLQKPPVFFCADKIHEPFRVMKEPAPIENQEDPVLWGIVKTTSWDFAGDRTDLHDVFSLVWGAVLRGFGIGSPCLIDDPHPAVPGEIDACHLLFLQCAWKISGSSFGTARKSLNAWSAFAFHLLDDVFNWYRGEYNSAIVRQTEHPKWAGRIIKYLRNPSDVFVSSRTFPFWIYFSSQDRGVTVVRLPKVRVSNLRAILTPFAPARTNGENSHVIFANGIPNAIPYKLDKRARKILVLTDDKCSDVISLPLDNHCLFIGDKTIVALRGEYGREIFEDERKKMMTRRSMENRVFYAESTIEWRTSLKAGDLEDLCLDLIRREPGVVRAKPVGTVYERDGGRDILIDWRVPNAHGAGTGKGAANDTMKRESKGTRIIRVIAQVKTRSRTIGKRDVQDIRDMLDHHDAEGFLLIAFPRISAALVNHLDKLGKTKTRAEWWESRDIEERLRRHPDIAKRYPQLVTLHPVS